MRVLVLGGGPAGVTAALHAAELGAKVTLVERGRVGGTALNIGPAPVRTLARAARLVRDWSSWETFGLRGPKPEVDLAATLANAERVAQHAYERHRVADHIRAMGVELVEEVGDAWFLDSNTVSTADGQEWTADRVIIAVGGRASRLPIPGAELGLTYEDVRSLASLPDRVCIIGAADTGCQLASILADFGCRVSLVEYAPRIVPRADEEVSAGLERAFHERGIEVVTNAAVQQLEPLESGVRVVYRAGDDAVSVETDAAFFAVGWPSNADLVDAEGKRSPTLFARSRAFGPLAFTNGCHGCDRSAPSMLHPIREQAELVPGRRVSVNQLLATAPCRAPLPDRCQVEPCRCHSGRSGEGTPRDVSRGQVGAIDCVELPTRTPERPELEPDGLPRPAVVEL